jgi:HAD superfamily hydrolase (TIGR01509 family)
MYRVEPRGSPGANLFKDRTTSAAGHDYDGFPLTSAGHPANVESSVVTILPAAVLWDMDGTLVDTEPHWMAAEGELIEQFGGTWSHEDALSVVGAGLWHTARVMQSHGVKLSEDDIISTLTDRVLDKVADSTPWRPGARELLGSLRANGIPTALVTMSIHRMAQHVTNSIDFKAFNFRAFDVIVAGDDVAHSKPHPAPYLRAAELLGVDILDCVAIEDSPPGVASATAAGAATIGIPMHVQLTKSEDFALWPTLVGRSISDLSEVLALRRAARARK